MSFNVDKCKLPTLFCGDAHNPIPKKDDYYHYNGRASPAQCRQKMFGAGYFTAKREFLPADSLQQIRYVGPFFEGKFLKKKIRTTTALLKYARGNTPSQLAKMLKTVCTNTAGNIDKRTYNMVLLWIYREGVSRLPSCMKI
jgi:hypothetical protein